MKSQLHFKTSKTGPDIRELEGLIPGCILLLMGPMNGGLISGAGGYNRKFTVSQSGHFLVIFWILANLP